MISYTIDPSVFVPPPIPQDDTTKQKYKNELKDFLDIIENCYDFIHHEGISVYIFHYTNNYFDEDYIKKAKNIGFPLPLDRHKRLLDDIYLYNMPKLHYGEKIGPIKYYFEDWFEIKITKYEKSIVKPSLQKQQDDNSEIDRVNMIGILNTIILKDSKFHYLIRNEAVTNLSLESQNIYFSLKKSSYFEQSLLDNIQLEPINNLDINYKTQYNSVFEVINHIKNNFSEYIIFGDDVKEGIKTIRDSAGPPDRIFAYLKTLVEFCELKREQKINFDDDYIIQTLGCICTYEYKDDMKNESFRKARIFDNGNNEKIQFSLHLKPNTFSEREEIGKRKRTVRIYISWDDNKKKVIVGWIGKHPENH